MPTYLYHCLDCEYKFEEFQSMTDPAIDKCPKCGGRAERIITGGAGFLFKGSGFYITDHRSPSYNKAKQADTSGSAGASPPPPPKKSENK